MADYIKHKVRAYGFQQAVIDCVLVDEHGGDERPLAESLTNLEVDRDRYKRDLDRVQQDFDELSRRHREEHAVVQQFIDTIKEKLAEGNQFIIDDWDDFDDAFDGFDGFDLDRPRRDWSADVKLTVKVSVAGDSDLNLDEDDIKSLILDDIAVSDIDVSVSFSYDDCEATDSSVDDYDVDSVCVEFT